MNSAPAATLRSKSTEGQRLPWPGVVGLCAVAVTIGYPLFVLLLQSLFPHMLEASARGFLGPYVQLWHLDRIADMWSNSVMCGLLATIGAWVFGVPAGWILARTDLWGKSIFRVSLLIPVMSPPYLLALAYVLMFQPKGMLTVWGIDLPEWVREGFFSFWGVVLVMALMSIGSVALLVEAALLGISTRMEDAARCLGCPTWRIFSRITLPLLLPALVNAGILVFIDAISNFGIAAILSPRAHVALLPQVIYEWLTSWPPNLAMGAAASTIMAVTAMSLVGLSRKLLALHTVNNGRLPLQRLMALGRGATVCAWIFFALIFLFSSLLPTGAVFFMSLVKRWEGGHPQFAWDNYLLICRHGSRGAEALSTSLLLSIGAATICVFIGAVVAYSLARYRGRLMVLLDQLSVLPRIVPNIVVAVAIILAWNVPWIPLPIYGTVNVLLLAYVALYQSTALRFGDAAMQQITPRLEQAAACLGLPHWRILWGIVFPMLGPSLLIAWITILIRCLRDWVASIMLLPPGVQTVGSFIFTQFEQGDFGQAMAMTVCTVVLSTALLAAANLRLYRKVV